ncbi:hypothetical protein SAMN05216361_2900 [Marisediminitalea aggregata]|uniref:Uncharacterized protein n=2 Tax=Alteromonadaceae TaxID=72275 RepID=A0A1M5M4T2_9ALTE|nr:hypothetical protein [Aestuariibacter sp.]SHG72246.1 hypothetical protein SAMN05216361_2900 [Marisediminitalea aggregata]
MNCTAMLDTSRSLAERIRNGHQPDNGHLLRWYIEFTEEVANDLTKDHQKFLCFIRCACVLVNTAYDQHIPWQWRTQCLDYVHRPLFAARSVGHTQGHQLWLKHIESQLMQPLP